MAGRDWSDRQTLHKSAVSDRYVLVSATRLFTASGQYTSWQSYPDVGFIRCSSGQPVLVSIADCRWKWRHSLVTVIPISGLNMEAGFAGSKQKG
jgi:hypothetical protein